MGFLAFLAVVNIILTPAIFVAALIKRQFWWIILSLFIYVVWYCVGPEFLTYEFEMGFGPGAIVTLSSIVAALLSIILFLAGRLSLFVFFGKVRLDGAGTQYIWLAQFFLCSFNHSPLQSPRLKLKIVIG